MVATRGVYASNTITEDRDLEFYDYFSLLWIIADMKAMVSNFECMPSETYNTYIKE